MADRLFDGLRVTLTDPRRGARMVLGWGLGWQQAGLVLAAGVAVTLLAAAIDLAVLSLHAAEGGPFLLSPLMVAVLVASVIVQGFLVLWIGRAFGGRADARQVAVAVTWANLAQAVAMGAADMVGLVLPGAVAVVLVVAAALWSLWILACFVAEAHGFDSPGRVLMAIIGFGLALGLVLAMLLGAAGLVPPGAG